MRQNDQMEISEPQTIRYRWRLTPSERGMPACLSYIVEGNRIRLPSRPGGVCFSFPIGDVIETEQAIVICLQIPDESACTENVYAIDRDGNLLWRVKSQSFELKGGPYTLLSLQGECICVHSRDGRSYELNPSTGSAIRISEFAG